MSREPNKPRAEQTPSSTHTSLQQAQESGSASGSAAWLSGLVRQPLTFWTRTTRLTFYSTNPAADSYLCLGFFLLHLFLASSYLTSDIMSKHPHFDPSLSMSLSGASREATGHMKTVRHPLDT